MPRWIPVNDDPDLPTAAEYRERSQRARTYARTRYRVYLAEVLGQHVDDPAAVTEVALDALTLWRDVETGEQCRCSCHPQLPDSDQHDFGFNCRCHRTRAEQRQSLRQALSDIDEYWNSPEGLRTRAADDAAERDLQDWLATQPGVVIDGHGGWAPEEWRGEVDGHSFYFRERHEDWHLQIDLHSTGRSIRMVDGSNDDGTTRYRQHAIQAADIIATGTAYTDGYGTAPLERAQFIVTTIRDHLTRAACTHHVDKLDTISTVIGTAARWCAACGAPLHHGWRN